MRRWTRRSLAVFCLSAVALSPADDGDPLADHRLRIDLPVVATTDRYPPYDDFCRRQPPAAAQPPGFTRVHRPETPRPS